jgi:cardiolipin synthase C
MRRAIAASALALLAAWTFVAYVGRLPQLQDRHTETFAANPGHTALAQRVGAMLASHPGLSGLYPLSDARDAFAARVLLAQAAERTLDVRYYIWQNDTTGALLFDAMRAAADRGVHVRILLDDNNAGSLDAILGMLDAHSNIEVRLFNPIATRNARWLGYLTDFARVNRRMHNKSFTADDRVAIVGGRNVGDEYFGAKDGVLFADYDVLAVGPVVDEVAGDFERYWNSGSSYPVGLLIAEAKAPASTDTQRTTLAESHPGLTVGESQFARWWQRGSISIWAPAYLVSDDPAKGLGLPSAGSRVSESLLDIIASSSARVDIVSPYFVPTQLGADTLIALAHRGVRVRVVTNSLEATDVAAVHAGYAKWRETLLQNGVALFELRHTPEDAEARATGKASGRSHASLHAKTFAIDGKRVYVGSYNFDPRSARLNTEMGLVIDSPELAGRLESVLDARLPSETYEVVLSGSGALQWLERDASGTVLRHDTEPGTSTWQRAKVRVLSWLPVERLL